jgi:hypothetical protein
MLSVKRVVEMLSSGRACPDTHVQGMAPILLEKATEAVRLVKKQVPRKSV